MKRIFKKSLAFTFICIGFYALHLAYFLKSVDLAALYRAENAVSQTLVCLLDRGKELLHFLALGVAVGGAGWDAHTDRNYGSGADKNELSAASGKLDMYAEGYAKNEGGYADPRIIKYINVSTILFLISYRSRKTNKRRRKDIKSMDSRRVRSKDVF